MTAEGTSMAPQPSTETERFHARLAPTSVAASESRTEFEHWLTDTAADEDVVDELIVVFSELLANAVEASAGASDEIDASAWADRDRIVLRVANPVVSTSAPVSQPDLADPLRSGGRGLVIVRAYTDTLSTELDDGSIAIQCERRLAE